MILIDRSIARWRCRWELRASSRIRCICILRVFVRRWTRWGWWCSSSSYPSSYFPDVFCCWIFDFFWVVFINYVREPRKEFYSSPSGCMSKPGKRRGNRGPSNSGLNTGRCGWKKKDTKRESLVSHKYKYEELYVRILIDTEFFSRIRFKKETEGEGATRSLCRSCSWSNFSCFSNPLHSKCASGTAMTHRGSWHLYFAAR